MNEAIKKKVDLFKVNSSTRRPPPAHINRVVVTVDCKKRNYHITGLPDCPPCTIPYTSIADSSNTAKNNKGEKIFWTHIFVDERSDNSGDEIRFEYCSLENQGYNHDENYKIPAKLNILYADIGLKEFEMEERKGKIRKMIPVIVTIDCKKRNYHITGLPDCPPCTISYDNLEDDWNSVNNNKGEPVFDTNIWVADNGSFAKNEIRFQYVALEKKGDGFIWQTDDYKIPTKLNILHAEVGLKEYSGKSGDEAFQQKPDDSINKNDLAFYITKEDIQDEALEKIGRKIAPEEFDEVKKGLQWGIRESGIDTVYSTIFNDLNEKKHEAATEARKQKKKKSGGLSL